MLSWIKDHAEGVPSSFIMLVCYYYLQLTNW